MYGPHWLRSQTGSSMLCACSAIYATWDRANNVYPMQYGRFFRSQVLQSSVDTVWYTNIRHSRSHTSKRHTETTLFIFHTMYAICISQVTSSSLLFAYSVISQFERNPQQRQQCLYYIQCTFLQVISSSILERDNSVYIYHTNTMYVIYFSLGQ